MSQPGAHIYSLSYRLRRFRRDSDRWSLLTLLVLFFLALPVLALGVNLFGKPGETWGHIVEHLLPDYIGNSLFLALVSGALVLAFGVTTAWQVDRNQYPFRKQLQWLLILPLPIPT